MSDEQRLKDFMQAMNQASDTLALNISDAMQGRDVRFAVNVLFTALAAVMGKMTNETFAHFTRAGEEQCTIKGCKCMRVRRQFFATLQAIRADYIATVAGAPRCKRFKDKPSKN